MAASVHVELDLNAGEDPIAGVLSVGGRPPRAFSGWVEFLGLLERARGQELASDEDAARAT